MSLTAGQVAMAAGAAVQQRQLSFSTSSAPGLPLPRPFSPPSLLLAGIPHSSESPSHSHSQSQGRGPVSVRCKDYPKPNLHTEAQREAAALSAALRAMPRPRSPSRSPSWGRASRG